MSIREYETDFQSLSISFDGRFPLLCLMTSSILANWMGPLFNLGVSGVGFHFCFFLSFFFPFFI